MGVAIPASPTRGNRVLDFCIVGKEPKPPSIKTNKSLSDHNPILIELSVPLPSKKQLIILPNRKLTDKMTVDCLKESYCG